MDTTATARQRTRSFDRILLKNGDTLSRHLQTKTFTLPISYGTFHLETPQIAYIDFDARGKNLDVLVFRFGDRLSGEVEVESVEFMMKARERVRFDGETIKKITFKR